MKLSVVPIVHPSWCFRGNWAHSSIQPSFLRRAKEVSEGRYVPVDTTTVPPEANLFPTLEDLHAFANETSGPLFTDIECAGDHLVCVGLLRPDGAYVCVRFRRQGGDIYDPDTLPDRAEWLYGVLGDASIEKVFHNGQAFDIPYLEKIGFEVNGYVGDTMLQAHLTYGRELPKRLDFLALLYAGIPNWKTLVKPEDEEKEQ